jgi:hypothetical protein
MYSRPEIQYLILIIAIHIGLLHEWEGDTMVQLAELSDLLVRSRFLASELIMRTVSIHAKT